MNTTRFATIALVIILAFALAIPAHAQEAPQLPSTQSASQQQMSPVLGGDTECADPQTVEEKLDCLNAKFDRLLSILADFFAAPVNKEVPAATEAPAATEPAAEAPAASAPAGPFVSLKYDESGEFMPEGQTRLIALYLRDAQAAGSSQEAMEKAISLIQQEASTVEATVFEGTTLTLDQHQAWMVWCSNSEGINPPSDVSDVFDNMPTGPGKVWIQVPFGENVPLRSDDAWTGCADGFWAVAVN